MKKQFFSLLALSALLFSCGETAEVETTDAHASEQTEHAAETHEATEAEEAHEEEETAEIAFNGVQKGAFTLFGHTDIDENDAVDSETMFASFEENGAFEGKVNVTINEVCQMAGCWINIKKSDDEVVKVFFRDHFTIPIESSAGKEAVLYGSLVRDTMTVEFQKHLLDDAKANDEEVSEEEYAAITEDKITVSFDCESILIKE